jgi:hypothetical protein
VAHDKLINVKGDRYRLRRRQATNPDVSSGRVRVDGFKFFSTRKMHLIVKPGVRTNAAPELSCASVDFTQKLYL